MAQFVNCFIIEDVKHKADPHVLGGDEVVAVKNGNNKIMNRP